MALLSLLLLRVTEGFTGGPSGNESIRISEGMITLTMQRHPTNHSEAHEERRRLWQRDGGPQTHRLRRLSPNVLDEAPLFIGTGTHYVNFFVGTPPQRVSVIVDTGSHYTAFPCNGCGGCGKHTDEYYDSKQSSTSREKKCGSGRCTFGQSYTEGSSWSAYKVVDKVWIGYHESTLDSVLSAVSCEFTFGCQTHETGLFTSQISNGIMGFAHNQQDTLVPNLVRAGVLDKELFTMCFARHGGAVVLGEVDTRLHKEPLQYNPMTFSGTWFAVKVLSVRVGTYSIGNCDSFQSGKGTIVDSGTTDTYLPRNVASGFRNAFQKAAGRSYSAGNSYSLSQSQLDALPSVYIKLEAVELEVKSSAYMDHISGTTYKPRIYLDEWSGSVLGANVMQDHDVVFDSQGKRMGWARADCTSLAPEPQPATARPTYRPTLIPTGMPTATPTAVPSRNPTHIPTALPTPAPTPAPTTLPSRAPTATPTDASCDDGEKGGFETDVDCGGATCPPCGDSRTCNGKNDCLSKVCEGGKCQTATPSPAPTSTPTKIPTPKPTSSPTVTPTSIPTDTPTKKPTATPTTSPSHEAPKDSSAAMTAAAGAAYWNSSSFDSTIQDLAAGKNNTRMVAVVLFLLPVNTHTY